METKHFKYIRLEYIRLMYNHRWSICQRDSFIFDNTLYTERHTLTYRNILTYRDTYRETYQTYRHTEGHTEKHTETYSTYRDKQIHIQRDMLDIQRHADRHTERHIRHTNIQRHTERHIRHTLYKEKFLISKFILTKLVLLILFIIVLIWNSSKELREY